MRTAIYYFSGTGNSLHVAQALQARISDSDLIPIVRQLSGDTIEITAGVAGLVFPNFCLSRKIEVVDGKPEWRDIAAQR